MAGLAPNELKDYKGYARSLSATRLVSEYDENVLIAAVRVEQDIRDKALDRSHILKQEIMDRIQRGRS